MKLLILSALAVMLITGCSTGVVSTGPDTYMVSASGAGFSTTGVRSTVYGKANRFCAQRGLVMMPISFNVQAGVLGQNPPSADLVFRALPPGDPEIKRPNIDGATQFQPNNGSGAALIAVGAQMQSNALNARQPAERVYIAPRQQPAVPERIDVYHHRSNRVY